MGMVNESKNVPRDAITESEILVERILEQRVYDVWPKYEDHRNVRLKFNWS